MCNDIKSRFLWSCGSQNRCLLKHKNSINFTALKFAIVREFSVCRNFHFAIIHFHHPSSSARYLYSMKNSLLFYADNGRKCADCELMFFMLMLKCSFIHFNAFCILHDNTRHEYIKSVWKKFDIFYAFTSNKTARELKEKNCF